MSLALVLLPLASMAAENNNQQERVDLRQQSRTLPENSINSLTTPASSQQQPRISSRQAMNIATDSYEGRVLGIRRDNDNWRVRMDRDGTVFNVFVDARSGNVSSSSD